MSTIESTEAVPFTMLPIEVDIPGDSSDSTAALVGTIIVLIVLGMIFLIATVLNTFFLVIFFRRPSFRNISNRFLVNLTISNLISTWIFLPLVMTEGILGDRIISPLGCHLMDLIGSIVASSSVIATLLVALDRFCAITDPLHYHMVLNSTKGAAMIAMGWLITVTTAAAGLVGAAEDKQWSICPKRTELSSRWWQYQGYYVSINVPLTFMIPVTVLIWLYLGIYRAAQGNSERARRTSLGGQTLDAVDPRGFSRTPSRTPSTRSTSSQIVTTLKHRISNASLFLYKEEARAAKISVLVIVLIVCCWTPFYVATVLSTSFIQVELPKWAHQITMVLALSNSALSSYIYFFRSRKFQREIRRLFGYPVSRRSIPKRKSQLQLSLNLEKIPPSPTTQNVNFDPEQYSIITQTEAKPQKQNHFSTIFSKLFQRWFMSEAWQESFSTNSSASSNSSTDATAVETDYMIPKIVIQT